MNTISRVGIRSMIKDRKTPYSIMGVWSFYFLLPNQLLIIYYNSVTSKTEQRKEDENDGTNKRYRNIKFTT